MINPSAGKRRRLARIFRNPSRNAIVIALDHGLFMGAMQGIERLPAAVEALCAAGVDAIQVGPGAAEWVAPALERHFEIPLVLRVDTTNAWRRDAGTAATQAWVASAEEAARAGADAVVVYLFQQPEFVREEQANFRAVAEMIRDCGRLGLPVMVEPLVLGGGTRESNPDPAVFAPLCRIAFEMGADSLKIDPPLKGGEMQYDALREICEAVPVPVLVRGGPQVKDPLAFAQTMTQAMAAGARGVVFGRNVWQATDIAEAVAQLRQAVHGESEA